MEKNACIMIVSFIFLWRTIWKSCIY